MEEIEFKNTEEFFNAIVSYQKEIDGKILRADSIPFIGIVVYREDENGEVGTYFTIRGENFGFVTPPPELQKHFKTPNQHHISDTVLIFVDGELYKGNAVYDNYKGVGWPSGRTAEVYLEKKLAARYQSVSIVYLKYGKLRHCKYNSKGFDVKSQLKAESTCWTVIDMPGDL